MKKNYKKHLNKIAVLALTMVLCLSNMGPSFAYIGELSGNPEKTETTEKHELYAEGEAIVCCVDYSNVDGQALKNEIKLIENELDEPKTEETDLSDLNALLKNSKELMDLGKEPLKEFEFIDKGILSIKSKSAGKASKILKHVVNEDMTTEELVEKLEELPNVEYAEPNYYKVSMAMDVDNYDWTDYQWAYNGDSEYGLNVPDWNVSGNANAEGVVVAVMDSGVNYNNPDLINIMWDEGENYPTLIALGGGKNGINTAGTTVAEMKDPMDNHSHGTHCSGIIGAQWNGKGVSGAGNGVKIMGVKVGDASMSTADIIEGFAYIKAAKQAGVNVVAVNNSWGGGAPGDKPTSTCNAITALNDVDIICVFAAGNENSNIDIYYDDYPYDSPIGVIPMDGYWDAYYYHDLPNTIIVGSNGMSGNRASYSNWGKNKVDVFAPGGDTYDYELYGLGNYVNDTAFYWGRILSTVSKGTANYPENYGTMAGTSMACPAVTGAVAILRAQYPDASIDEIIAALKDGVTEGKDDIKAKCDAEGYVNVEKSLEILAATYSASEDAKPFASITSTNDGFEDQTVTLIASAEAGIAAYYWGTDASGDPQETSGISADGTLNTTKVVSADGKYYLIAKDASGNSVSQSMEFYKTTFSASNATVSPAYVIVEAGKSYNLPEYTAISANAGYIAPTTNTSLWKESGSNAVNGGASFTPNGSFTLNLNQPCKKTVAKPTSPADVTYTGNAQTIGIATPEGVTRSGDYTATNVGTYTAKYTPQSGYCWEDGTTTTVSVQWKIVQAANGITAPDDQTWNASYSTSAQTKTLTGFSNANGTVTYSISGDAKGFSISETTLTMPANKPVGTYTLTIKGVAAGEDYYASGDATFNVTVNVTKAANRITAPADQTWNATFSSDAQTKEITGFSNADGNVTYSISGEASGFTISGTTLTMPANKTSGTYTLIIKGVAAGDMNHYSGTATFKVIVNIGSKISDITLHNDTDTNMTYTEGFVTSLSNPTREGYNFIGWYDNAEYLGEPVTEISAGATGDLEFWAKWIANTYSITNETPQAQAASSNGSIEVSSEASCGSDVIVTIHANSGYVLDTLKYKLTGGSETTISKSGSVYKFTMPAGNVTVKATFKEEATTPPGGGGSGGGGGGAPSDDTPSESGPINANINIGTETDSIDVTVENGAAKIGEISKSDLEDAARNNDKTKSKAIVIDLSQGGSLESVELTTSTVINILDVLKSNKNAFNTFEIQLIDATLSFNTKAVESVKKQSKGSTIDFAVVKITPSNLNDTQKEKLMKKEVGLVFNATIESGGSSIHTFNGGKAFVGIKFTVPAGKKAENAKAYYIDNKGKMQKMATKCVDGNLMFATPHFSDFAIVFEDKPESVTLKAKASGKRAIKLSWNSIGGAEKYVVYGAKKGKALKKIKTLKSKSYKVTKASGSKLKSRATYKFCVVAYDALGQKFKSKTISKKAR